MIVAGDYLLFCLLLLFPSLSRLRYDRYRPLLRKKNETFEILVFQQSCHQKTFKTHSGSLNSPRSWWICTTSFRCRPLSRFPPFHKFSIFTFVGYNHLKRTFCRCIPEVILLIPFEIPNFEVDLSNAILWLLHLSPIAPWLPGCLDEEEEADAYVNNTVSSCSNSSSIWHRYSSLCWSPRNEVFIIFFKKISFGRWRLQSFLHVNKLQLVHVDEFPRVAHFIHDQVHGWPTSFGQHRISKMHH